MPDLDAILVPTSGGGMLAGIIMISLDRIIIGFDLILSYLVYILYERPLPAPEGPLSGGRSRSNYIRIMIRYRYRREERQSESSRVCRRADGQEVRAF